MDGNSLTLDWIKRVWKLHRGILLKHIIILVFPCTSKTIKDIFYAHLTNYINKQFYCIKTKQVCIAAGKTSATCVSINWFFKTHLKHFYNEWIAIVVCKTTLTEIL